MSKGAEVDSSMSEIPQHQRPRRLADWLNPTGRRRVHSLIPPSVLITRRRLRESGMRENRTYRLSGGRRPAPAGRASSDPTPVKAANKGAQAPAEPPEGRASTKGNLRDQSTPRTQGRDGVSQAVERIRQAATRKPQEKLTALLHHITTDALRCAFYDLQKTASAGGVALLRRRPRRLLRAARQELLDPSKAWWEGRRGRLADRRCYPISVSLGVVPLVLARFVEVPVRIEVAAGS